MFLVINVEINLVTSVARAGVTSKARLRIGKSKHLINLIDVKISQINGHFRENSVYLVIEFCIIGAEFRCFQVTRR